MFVAVVLQTRRTWWPFRGDTFHALESYSKQYRDGEVVVVRASEVVDVFRVLVASS